MRGLALLVLLASGLAAADGFRVSRLDRRDRLSHYLNLGQSFPITTTRASVAYYEADDSFVYSSPANTPRETGVKGVLSFEARGNLGTNSLDASAWTNTGTPIVTTNVASGPYSRIAGAPEIDEIVDDDGTASEGKIFASITSGVTLGDYTATCSLAAGTTGPTTTTARLFFFTTGGTLSASTCNISGLTSTVSKHTCPTVLSGAATRIDAWLIVGATGTDTGSIRVSECQLEKASFAGPPLPCQASQCSTNADVHTTPTTGWPTTSGEVELIYQPHSGSPNGYTLLDSRTAGNGPGFHVGFFATNLSARSCDGTTCTFATSTGLTWAAGASYCIKYVWGSGGSTVYRATSSGGACGSYSSVATAAGTNLPTGHDAAANVGSDLGGSAQANGWVKLLYVGVPR